VKDRHDGKTKRSCNQLLNDIGKMDDTGNWKRKH